MVDSKARSETACATFRGRGLVPVRGVLAVLAAAAALTACGGGGDGGAAAAGPASVSSITVQESATLGEVVVTVEGQNLIGANGGGPYFSFTNCSDPEPGGITATRAVMSCTPTARDISVRVTDANSAVIATHSEVRKPRVYIAVWLPQDLLPRGVVLDLEPDAAPQTVANFIQYARDGYYDNTLFHRVIPGFMAQAGGFTAVDTTNNTLTPQTGTRAPIPLESNVGLSNRRGTIAMARLPAPDSATGEFFINLVDNVAGTLNNLDYKNAGDPGYAVFGTVISGMEHVDAMAGLPTRSVGIYDDVPQSDIVIYQVRELLCMKSEQQSNGQCPGN